MDRHPNVPNDHLKYNKVTASHFSQHHTRNPSLEGVNSSSFYKAKYNVKASFQPIHSKKPSFDFVKPNSESITPLALHNIRESRNSYLGGDTPHLEELPSAKIMSLDSYYRLSGV
jgi:hypothetical protein